MVPPTASAPCCARSSTRKTATGSRERSRETAARGGADRMTSEAPHILVVDDDDRLRELLRKFLSENGYLVTSAADAKEARNRMASLAFDLIVLDIMMPGETGLSLAASLRPKNETPILMLTAMGETEDRIKGL